MELNGGPVSANALHGLALYNYGHFTTFVVEGQTVRGFNRHLQRLTHDCGELFGTDLDPQWIRSLVSRVAARSPDPVVIRVTVFDPDFDLGHPRQVAEPQVLVSARPAPTGAPAPLRLSTVSYERDLPHVKHTALLGALHHRRRSQRQGYDDALFVDRDRRICEGATWNIGFADGDRVLWPQGDKLPGVTTWLLDQIIARAGIRCETVPLSLADLPTLGHPFVANAAVGVRAVERVDSHVVAGASRLVSWLADAYRDLPGEPL
jgi:branched-subunit amino acid aminotransferase/4-amino-4-deoxychorismate lyase